MNGHNYEDFVEGKSLAVENQVNEALTQTATEPFDEGLDRNVKSLHIERVAWEGTVVQKRRTHPITMNKLSKELERRKEFGEWVPADDVPLASTSCVCLKIVTDVVGEGGTDRDIPKPDRYQETVDTFTTVASNLSELAQVCPIAICDSS